MNIEILFKNGIFLSLFLSMISFWTENIVSNTSSKKEPNPINFSEKLFFISFSLLTFELIYRWFLSGHPPLSNLYESLLFLIWGLVGFFLFVYTNRAINKSSNNTLVTDEKSSNATKNADIAIENNILIKTSFISPRNFVGCILSSTALFIQTFADWRLPSEMRDIKPLIPALQSNWLLMHVSIMILSYAALLIGSIIAITYIIIFLQSNKVVNKATNESVKSLSLPNAIFLEELDSLSYRILAFGFPLLTLGILSGSVWANEAWGSYWSWDPKETWAFITWLIFAFYLHTRLQYGWEGEKSAFVASFGFFIVWICYLGVNLLGKGLHSYGWLS
jgi:cytochrome c-type biogenesis protein CcsB